MVEFEDPNNESHVERKVVYEQVSSSSSRGTGVVIAVILAIAVALVAWILMHMH